MVQVTRPSAEEPAPVLSTPVSQVIQERLEQNTNDNCEFQQG